MVIGASPNLFVVPAQCKKHDPGEGQSGQNELDKSRRHRHHPATRGRIAKERAGIIWCTFRLPAPVPPTSPCSPAKWTFMRPITEIGHGAVKQRQSACHRRELPRSVGPICRMFLRSMNSVSRPRKPSFQGLLAPAGTLRPNSSTGWRRNSPRFFARPDIREKFAKTGLAVLAEGPEAFRARIAREVPMYKEIIDKAGLRDSIVRELFSRRRGSQLRHHDHKCGQPTDRSSPNQIIRPSGWLEVAEMLTLKRFGLNASAVKFTHPGRRCS